MKGWDFIKCSHQLLQVSYSAGGMGTDVGDGGAGMAGLRVLLDVVQLRKQVQEINHATVLRNINTNTYSH